MTWWILSMVLSACGGPDASPPPPPAASAVEEVPVPTTRRADHVDVYHGTEVADPYVWLEDLDSDETRAWVAAQNAATRAVLDALPHRAALVERLTALWRFPRWDPPVVRGDRQFYTYNDGTWDQPVLLVQSASETEPRTLFDPNRGADDGTIAMANWRPSKDGRHVALSLAEAGSDWRTWHVLDVATGELLPDRVSWSKFSDVSWLPDGSGFFYSRYPKPSTDAYEEKLAFHQLWFHRVGTSQDADVLVIDQPDQPEWGFGGEVTDDGTRLIVTVWQGTEEKSRQWFVDLSGLELPAGGRAEPKVVKLLDAFDADYRFVGQEGDRMWFTTNLDAPRGRLLEVDVANPRPDAWKELVPQAAGTLREARFFGGRFLLTYLEEAHSEVVVFEPSGERVGAVSLPGLGTVEDWTGSPDRDEAAFSFTTFTRPSTVYRLTVSTGAIAPVWKADLAFDPDRFLTEQVTYTSKDGTPIPMFLTRAREADASTPRPTLLYGYGGFNIPITPTFKVENLAWLELGGVYAVANIRGGGERGQAWHLAGTRMNKQNVFDDFIAAAEHLVAQGWTEPARLGVHGRSNGGLLIGAVVTQRPDLFGAALPAVGVMDMLKYHRWTIGWAWASDYGTVDDDEAMFRYLLAYSPVHNARAGTVYPPTLVTTGDHDDRVVPAHSYKFTAALQQAQAGPAPVLARIETRAGHGAGTPVSMLVEEAADKLAFLAHHLKVPAASP